jgi:hypothetical protein
VTPVIRFEGGPVSGTLSAWLGPWPPDEIIGVAVGNLTGRVTYFDPDDLPAGVTLADLHAVATVAYYRRATYSQLPEAVDDMAHVARAALYRPDATR